MKLYSTRDGGYVLLNMSYNIRSWVSSFSFPSSVPPASVSRSRSEEMTDHIWKMPARSCLVVEVETEPSTNEQGGQGWGDIILKNRVRYFHILVWFLIIICSQKGMRHFLKGLPAIQHFTIFCSLLSVLVVTWIMFSSHKHIKK